MKKNNKYLKIISFVILMLFMSVTLCGCWDKMELNELFIVTAIALDTAEDPGKINVTMQIANIKQQSQTSGQSQQNKSNKVILITRQGSTISEVVAQINYDSERLLIPNHLQVIAIGEELARKGIKDHLDVFVRDLKTRLETPVVIVKGRAEQLISARLAQEDNSGIFITGMFERLAKISKKYRERVIDILSCLLDKTCESSVPYIEVVGEKGEQEIKLRGMAILHQDKMVTTINTVQTSGLIWAMGKVKEDSLQIENEYGATTFVLDHLKTKTKVALKEDGKIQVNLKIQGSLFINEIKGYDKFEPEELMTYLNTMAEKQIASQIMDCLEAAKTAEADIFGFGKILKQTDPKAYRSVMENWKPFFSDLQIDIETKLELISSGLIVEPIDLGEGDENR